MDMTGVRNIKKGDLQKIAEDHSRSRANNQPPEDDQIAVWDEKELIAASERGYQDSEQDSVVNIFANAAKKVPDDLYQKAAGGEMVTSTEKPTLTLVK